MPYTQGALGWRRAPDSPHQKKSFLLLATLLLSGFTLTALCQTDNSAYPPIDLVFSEEEKQWIKTHPEILYTGDPNWLPYEAFEKDGSYIGIVADHLGLIAHYAGIEFKPRRTVTWSQSLDVAMAGEVDIISGDLADAILNRGFNPVTPYSRNPIVIIMDTKQNYVEDLKQLKGRKIAIIKDYGYTADIYATYPDFGFIEVENIQEGLNGVAEKRFDAMLATMALASYHMAQLGLHNIKVVGKTPITMELTLFVDKEEPVLHSIMNKTLQALPRSLTQDILQKWITREYVEKVDYHLFLQMLLGISLLFTLIMWWIYRLRMEINRRKKVEGLLRESEHRYDLAMSVANDGIWDWDLDKDEVLFDVRYYTIAGYRPFEFPQAFSEWEIRVHPQDISEVKIKLEHYLAGSSTKYDAEFRFLRKQGDYMWIQTRGKVVEWGVDGKPKRVVGTHSDISQERACEQQLKHIAHFDSLTNLPNRILLIDRLNQAMYQAQRRGMRLAVVYLDLDGFKAINDDNDHETGDRFLQNIARRMQEALRKGDTLSRLGGDEFVAVLVDLPSTEESVPLVKRLLDAAAIPISVDKLFLKVSASIGVTFFPQEKVVDAEQLIRQADHSMYQAKMQGKNRFHIFDFEYDSNVVNQRKNLESALEAFEKQEYVVYYQPKVNMHTGEVTGLEALIRWRHPRMGILTPSSFLSYIENSELEIKLGEWVIITVLQQLSDWLALGSFPPVSINIGSMHLQQKDFVERLSSMLEMFPDVGPGSIELEVLESNALDDLRHVSRVIEACAKLGVNFALDDFGTGYSSLTYLKQLPAATLKIDQNFVRDMLDDPEDLAILEGVIGIASAFNREVIAEGVETVEQGDLLLKMGCQLAQGYQIARPMPAEKVISWMKHWHPCHSWLQQQAYPREDFSILFAGVEHRAWIKSLERFIYWETEQLPIRDYTQCSFGSWLLGEGKKRFGDSEVFLSLERLHIEIHQLAEQLIELHYKGNQKGAKAGIDDLLSMRDRLIDYLDLLVADRNKVTTD
jgi:diguanylate cyclase (GGDEF)-like protein/PAS domain S-box-containing protein